MTPSLQNLLSPHGFALELEYNLIEPKEFCESGLGSFLSYMEIRRVDPRSSPRINLRKISGSRMELFVPMYENLDPSFGADREKINQFLAQQGWEGFGTNYRKDVAHQGISELIRYLEGELTWEIRLPIVAYSQVPSHRISEINLPIQKLVKFSGKKED